MIDHIQPATRMSQATIHDGIVYLAGQVGDPDKTFEAQAIDAMERVDDLLAAAGSDRGRMMQATVWLADRADYATFNALWDAWLDGATGPARATAIVGFPDPRYRVEIIVVAATAA